MIFRKKNKFSAGLFITTSLISVVVLICFIALGRSYIDSHWDAVDVNKTSEAGKNKTQIIIRDNHHKDPFITRATPKRDKITQPIVVSDSISFGQDKASLTIVEFSDFKCDYCREQEKIIKDLVRNEYNNDVKLIWKDY